MEFRPDGTVRADLGDPALPSLWLRRPTFGEFKQLRYGQLMMVADLTRLGEDATEELIEVIVCRWWELAIGLLAPWQMDVSDPPPWMVDPLGPVDVMNHFRYVPHGPWKKKGTPDEEAMVKSLEDDDYDPFEEPSIFTNPTWTTGQIEDEFTSIYVALSMHTKIHGPIPQLDADRMDLTTVGAMLGVKAKRITTFDENGVPDWFGDDDDVAYEMELLASQLTRVP